MRTPTFKPVIQFSLLGDVIAYYPSIKEASITTKTHISVIIACCQGKINQSKGFIWMYNEDKCFIKDRIKKILDYTIPSDWGTVWKDVRGFENKYKVSDFGIIIRVPYLDLSYKRPRIFRFRKMTLSTMPSGYLVVKLSDNMNRKPHLVHRIVAEAFIQNPNNLPQINHIDENKRNNHVDNLEWCDCKYNLNYGTARQRTIKKNTNGKLSKAIIQIDAFGNFIAEYPSMREARRHGYDNSAIAKCCLGKAYLHRGYRWKYK